MLLNDPVYDWHVHSEFSPDSQTSLEASAQLAEQLSIHIGYLDHFELAFLNRRDYLNYDGLSRLLEEFDRIHARFPSTSLGLEVDFYSDRSPIVAEFCDDFRKDFDYFIGSVHTIDSLAVTTKPEMDVLVKRIGLLEIIQRYFNEIDGAIQSRLFDGIAHIDGVMRFVPLYDFNQKIRDLWLNRTYALGELCQKLGILIEINLRGLNHPWGQMHPSEFIIARLITLGAKFYVGSDSHTLMDLKAAAPRLKQLQVYLLAQDSLGRPDFL